jgi:hypothetical protein
MRSVASAVRKMSSSSVIVVVDVVVVSEPQLVVMQVVVEQSPVMVEVARTVSVHRTPHEVTVLFSSQSQSSPSHPSSQPSLTHSPLPPEQPGPTQPPIFPPGGPPPPQLMMHMEPHPKIHGPGPGGPPICIVTEPGLSPGGWPGPIV